MSYMTTEALGPYFRQEMISDMLNKRFTVAFDETTNSAGEKELQIAIRFWSISKKIVVNRHLETFFINDGKGET